MNSRRLLGLTIGLLLAAQTALAEDSVSTFTLDGLSFISFGDQQILLPNSGATLRFRFGTPAADGSVPFTLRPEDVSIAPVPLPSGGGTLQYSIVETASGTLRPTPEGREISFTATVRATLASPSRNGSFDYTMPFTTESATARNLARTETLSVSGMRLVDGAWYGQIVGGTTNKENAFPEPGAAVYTVLSGSFDRIPE